MRHLRIENDTVMGNQTRVWYVDDDGTETEISSCVERVEFTAEVGEPNRAILHAIKVHTRMTAEVDEIVARHVPPRWRRLRRFVDVTTFSRDGVKQYVR